MNNVIIYTLQDGGVAVVHPTGELPIEEVARKDVPAGVEYKFMDRADIPADSTFRAAWETDMSNPDGVGIGADAWFAEQEQA
jgi:hypothetical protein